MVIIVIMAIMVIMLIMVILVILIKFMKFLKFIKELMFYIKRSRLNKIDSTGAHLVHVPGWMDGLVGGWMGVWKEKPF
jgi:hypothetical protein